MCKKCYRKYQIEWAKKRQPLLEQMRAAMPDQSEVPKICIKCGHIKPTKEFGSDKKTLDGKTGTCIVCSNKKISEYLAIPANGKRRKDRINMLYHIDEGNQGKTYLKQKDLERKQRDSLTTRAREMQGTMIYNARRKGFKFDPIYTVEKLIEMISNTDYCPCCTKKIDRFYYGDGIRRDSVPCPDRVNPDWGYIEGNVVIICVRCNWIKSNGKAHEFLKLVKWMTELIKNQRSKVIPDKKTYSSKKNNPVRFRADRIRKHMISNSRKKGLYFDPALTLDRIQEMIEERDYCPCCNRKLDKSIRGDGKRHSDVPSLDRFDSNLDYTEENIVVICWRCNNLKNNATVQELYNITVYILRYSFNEPKN